MSAILTILMQLLPVILPLLAAIFGFSAKASHDALASAAGSPEYLSYVGGNAAAASLAAYGSVHALIHNVRRYLAAQQAAIPKAITLPDIVAATGATSLLAMVRFFVRAMQLVSADKEARELFGQAFGVPLSSVPRTEQELLTTLCR